MDPYQPELPEDDLTSMEKGLRHFYIARIVRIVVPKPDANALYDARMLEFVEYCKYMEKRAFGKTTTRDEYFAALAKIIFKLQKKVQLRPPGLSGDPYASIPMSHEMAEFMGMTPEEQKEFEEHQNPQGPSKPKEQIYPHIRTHVVDKLGSMLFPPPDRFARYDGRMDTITEKLRQIEATAFEEAQDCDDYYNRASLAAYRLQKTIRKNGESYVDAVTWTPATTKPDTEDLPDVA